jgi:hypothetical protein
MRGRLRVCVGSHAAGNVIGASGCSALAQALPRLSALQELNLRSNLILFMFFFCLQCDVWVGCVAGFGCV